MAISIYPAITSVTAINEGVLIVNYNVCSAANDAVLTTRQVPVLGAQNVCNVRDLIIEDLGKVAAAAAGSPALALQGAIANYTAEDWKKWGL